MPFRACLFTSLTFSTGKHTHIEKHKLWNFLCLFCVCICLHFRLSVSFFTVFSTTPLTHWWFTVTGWVCFSLPSPSFSLFFLSLSWFLHFSPLLYYSSLFNACACVCVCVFMEHVYVLHHQKRSWKYSLRSFKKITLNSGTIKSNTRRERERERGREYKKGRTQK